MIHFVSGCPCPMLTCSQSTFCTIQASLSQNTTPFLGTSLTSWPQTTWVVLNLTCSCYGVPRPLTPLTSSGGLPVPTAGRHPNPAVKKDPLDLIATVLEMSVFILCVPGRTTLGSTLSSSSPALCSLLSPGSTPGTNPCPAQPMPLRSTPALSSQINVISDYSIK